MSMQVGGLPFKVCVFFACAPDEELSSSDIATRYTVKGSRYVNEYLKPAVEAGYLTTRRDVSAKTSQPTYYSAGPLLLRMLGRPVK